MSEQYSFENVDSLLFQFVLQTREMVQKKNEINQQIKAYRADIAERKSYIGTTQKDVKHLEEKIKATQSSLIHCKEFAKSMRMTNNLRAQVLQMLKDELESRTVSYNQDKEVYEERIASYKKTFQSHKEYHCQNPLAQKLLALLSENESIESRIRACDDQITMKQKELDILTGPENSSSNEKVSDSDPGQQPSAELVEPLDPTTMEDRGSSIDISSLHLDLVKDDQITSVEENAEETYKENIAQDTVTHVQEEEETTEMASCPPVYEQRWPDVTHSERDNQNTALVDQGEESAEQDKNEERMEEKVEAAEVEEKEQALSTENEEPTTVPTSLSQETNPQSSPAAARAASTPTFPFDFSPGSSPRHGTSDTKSPAFLFSLNSDPSTPGFSGFGFDVCSSKDEDSSFAFTSPFFSEKKTSGSKSPGCSDFPFGQAEQGEDFQFAFSAKSPKPDKKENSGDEFPFSFNF